MVPFALFVYFSHPENADHNAEQNTPQAIIKAPQLASATHMIRFMQPGGIIDFTDDSAARLAPQRMVKNGYDKGRPLMTVAYLARNVGARVARQLQDVLRRFSSAA